MPSGHVGVFLAGWVVAAGQSLRGANCWSETTGEILGKICINLVGYAVR